MHFKTKNHDIYVKYFVDKQFSKPSNTGQTLFM